MEEVRGARHDGRAHEGGAADAREKGVGAAVHQVAGKVVKLLHDPNSPVHNSPVASLQPLPLCDATMELPDCCLTLCLAQHDEACVPLAPDQAGALA